MSVQYESWFGSSLPSGWAKTTVRAAFKEETDRSGESLDNYLSLTANAGVIPYAEKGDVGNKAPEDMSKCKKVSPGDFVLNSMNFGIGSFGVSGYEGVCSSVYLVLKPNSEIFNSQYLKRIFELSSFQTYAQSLGNGILAHRAAFGWDKLRNVPLPLPPRAEQDAIVGFLDHELAKVDKLIEMQLSLISLASEHLEVNILHKVTGQDFLSARVHSPNLAWSPDLPEGWESTTIRHFAQVFAGGTPDRSNPDFWEDGQIPWINSGSVNQGRVTTPSALITEAAVRSSSTRLAPKGAIVIALAGQGATKGTPALMEIDAFCNQSMAAIVCDSRVDARYLYFWLRANYLNIRSMGGGDLRDGLNLEHIKSISCPIPPKTVQVKIAEELEGAVLRGNRLREQLELTITKLLERRAAVVSAAVTGKLKIQGAN